MKVVVLYYYLLLYIKEPHYRTEIGLEGTWCTVDGMHCDEGEVSL